MEKESSGELGESDLQCFSNGLDEEVEGMLIRFADNRKLCGITNIDRNNIQNNLDNLEKHAKSNRK